MHRRRCRPREADDVTLSSDDPHKEIDVPDPVTVDDYLATLPEDRRGPMEALRAAIRAAAPGAVEVISYKMPAFKTHGRFLVSYDAYKRHYSLFPASDAVVEAIGDELAPYLAGRGTIHFPAREPIPTDLVRRIVKVRVAENDARAAETEGPATPS
jgi:uncharacterized protein YdhG (YjbR/CyaY superfamily)